MDIGLIWSIGCVLFSAITTYIVAQKVNEEKVRQIKEQLDAHPNIYASKIEIATLRDEVAEIKNYHDKLIMESLDRLRSIELKLTELATILTMQKELKEKK